MEEKSIIVSTAIIEMMIEGKVRIKSSYSPCTTGAVRYEIKRHFLSFPEISVHEFDEREMEYFGNFFNSNNLSYCSFNDATAIFYAMTANIPLLVSKDEILETICKRTKAPYIFLNDVQIDETTQIHSQMQPSASYNQHEDKYLPKLGSMVTSSYDNATLMTG